MLKVIIGSFLFFTLTACHRKQNPNQEFNRSLFQSIDHTKENLFSGNIEGPAIDKNGRLFVVNYIRDGTIGLVHPDGKVELFVELPKNSTGNAIQFNDKGNMLVADFTGHNILEIDMDTKAISVYAHSESFNQPNDICINKRGIVFASDPDWKKTTGQLWKIGKDKIPVVLKKGMGTTNGICLNPSETILYVNESVQKRIWAFDITEEGELSNQRLFATVEDYGFDGMKCDRKGNLYVTRYGKGTVAVFNPSGKQIQEVILKGKNVSNIVFGGNDNRTAFVTLQDRKGIEKFRVDEGR